MAIAPRPNTDVASYVDEAGGTRYAVPFLAVNQDGTALSSTSGVVGVNMQRPADTTAYAVGDLIANSTVAGSVTPLTFALSRAADRPVIGRRVRLKVNDVAWKAAVIRVHLFRNLPAVTVGDNGVLNTGETYAFTESDYLGFVDVTLAQATIDGYAKGFASIDVIATPAAGTVNIYGLLETRTVVTPGSAKMFSTVIEALRD